MTAYVSIAPGVIRNQLPYIYRIKLTCWSSNKVVAANGSAHHGKCNSPGRPMISLHCPPDSEGEAKSAPFCPSAPLFVAVSPTCSEDV